LLTPSPPHVSLVSGDLSPGEKASRVSALAILSYSTLFLSFSPGLFEYMFFPAHRNDHLVLRRVCLSPQVAFPSHAVDAAHVFHNLRLSHVHEYEVATAAKRWICTSEWRLSNLLHGGGNCCAISHNRSRSFDCWQGEARHCSALTYEYSLCTHERHRLEQRVARSNTSGDDKQTMHVSSVVCTTHSPNNWLSRWK